MEGGKATIRTAIKLDNKGKLISESQKVEAGSSIKIGETVSLPEKPKEDLTNKIPEITKSPAKKMKPINPEELREDIKKLYE